MCTGDITVIRFRLTVNRDVLDKRLCAYVHSADRFHPTLKDAHLASRVFPPRAFSRVWSRRVISDVIADLHFSGRISMLFTQIVSLFISFTYVHFSFERTGSITVKFKHHREHCGHEVNGHYEGLSVVSF